ncbi:MAG: tRNA pseudouridine(55) synthase TruB [Sulfuricella sp.]|nr:tRNA pseudouridine(55) synthase TruB [Sulfuricella sp.]
MQFKRVKRRVDGVLLLDKPIGISSNSALQKAKILYQAAKAGHTGNLDPVATGLLPLCFGEATKFSHYLLNADKTYRAEFTLGQTSTTGDSEGELTPPIAVAVSQSDIDAVLQRFLGEISQIPPMYSALKFQGKALYEYARKGIEIERQPRQVVIYSLDQESFDGVRLRITVKCSKGTYIRVLGEDIGRALGCGAYMSALRRTVTSPFVIADAVTIDQLGEMDMAQRDAALMPADVLLGELPAIVLDDDSAFYLRRGNPVWLPRQVMSGVARLYDSRNLFLGVGEMLDDGKIAPRRLVNHPDN